MALADREIQPIPKGQRIHMQRLKQATRKAGAAHS